MMQVQGNSLAAVQFAVAVELQRDLYDELYTREDCDRATSVALDLLMQYDGVGHYNRRAIKKRLKKQVRHAMNSWFFYIFLNLLISKVVELLVDWWFGLEQIRREQFQV